MAINTHKDGHLEYITSSDGTKHYLNAEYLDGHSYSDISKAIGGKGTVTSVATADGITGGSITTSGTIRANLKSYTKNTAEIGGGLYGVELDKNGKLAVNVPLAGFEDILKGIKGRTQVEWNALNAGEYGSNSTYNGATLPPVILENTSGFWNSASGRPLDISFHFTKKERITTLQVKCPPYSGANPTMTVYYAQKGDAGLTLYKEIATISTADRKAYEFNEEGISADYWVVRFTSSGWVDLRFCSPSGLFTTGLYTEECHQQIMDRFNGYQPVGNYALKNEIIEKSLTSAKGDMIYASAASTPARLGIGSNGQFLSVANGIPAWVNNPNTDTKNTAGAMNDAGKLYLVGAKTQDANPQTYSYSQVYMTDGTLATPALSTRNIVLPESNLGLKFVDGDNVASAANFHYESIGGAYLDIAGHLFLNEAGAHPDKPENKTGLNYMSYADYFDTGIALVGKRTSSDLPSIIRLSFPGKSGTLSTVKYKHNIVLSGAVIGGPGGHAHCTFSFINDGPAAISSWSSLCSALSVNFNDKVCPACGLFGYDNDGVNLGLIIGIMFKSDNIYVYCKQLASTTSAGVMTITSGSSAEGGRWGNQISSSATVIDTVEEC